ncbi:MAG: hypothetical protein K2M41_06030 [Muribaculaceae bacterium]|nr:hypothetical protein [Muribaculaceae bacterium]
MGKSEKEKEKKEGKMGNEEKEGKDNNGKTRYFEWYNTVFVVLASVVIIVVLSVSGIIFHDSVKYPSRTEKVYVDDTWMAQREQLYTALEKIQQEIDNQVKHPSHTDSKRVKKTNNQNDTTLISLQGSVRKINNSLQQICIDQNRIISQQEVLLNDVRQETNNFINKANGLISIWIGIFALFGILLPIVWQFRLRKEYKQAEEDLNNKIDRSHKEKNEEIDRSLKGKSEEIDRSLKEKREEINRSLKKVTDEIETVKREKEKSELNNLTRVLEVCNDYRLIPNHTATLHAPIQNYFWYQVLKISGRIIEESFDEGNHLISEKKEELLETLLFLFSIVRNYNIAPSPHRKREYDQAIDRLRKEIYELCCNTTLSNTNYLNELKDLLNNLSELYK